MDKKTKAEKSNVKEDAGVLAILLTISAYVFHKIYKLHFDD